MTRYEAAALLNACDRVTEVTDELRRLIKEFETEPPCAAVLTV